jgi:hypothetical protein
MEINKFMRVNCDARITLGDMWLVYENEKFWVYERRKYQRKTRTVGIYDDIGTALGIMTSNYYRACPPNYGGKI